ncbi:TRAP transporter substrate-binding protein [Pandoraea sp. XJJ-1]|uniref:Sialic acid-binding periplasmic protein SiaP n=1 Tax=Pandoraea cepalis TaxID=2508294 RepID=A0A5E4YDW7_9BURK|nr:MULTISPECIES: TRAP transporter substrate-binding protein [Pandoraea]OJY20162.1 MAG: ABC transporter substrate-binding protein [Pandoraea sp. 64-18]WAL84310.1 TRAP transporter substrate-binding protein [Pandoraea sp. XJJ-1]VVE46343.1 Sialic acid-binding periplasmic protein SiaP [Pandoraea cepalis]
MQSLSRRSMLKLSLGTAIAAPAILKHTRVYAADFTLKYANNAPITHPLTVRITEAAEAIRKETGGKVDLRVFPNNQLGGDTDMLSQLRAGALDFFTLSPMILSTLVPKAAISGVGFAFKGYDHVWSAMDGELGDYVRAQIERGGLHPFPKIFDNGFRQISSSTRTIKTPDDLKSFKIRVPPSPMWTSMFQGFGAAPLTINFAEVYSALQTKIADGQENPLVTINSAKLYEVQKYVAKTNHMWDGFWFLSNRASWAKLPAEVRKVIEDQITAAALKQRTDVAALNDSLEKDLTAKGIAFNSVDAAAFQNKLQTAGFYKEWQGKFGEQAWALLQKSAGRTL